MRPKSPKAVLAQALERAGKILLRYFGRATIRYKGKANIVTNADLSSERTIIGIIRREFPTHDILAEEGHGRESGSEHLWIIDPLDGTTNFAHGYPVSCVSIAYLHRGRPLAGGIYDPFRDECFLAEKGGGARLNGRRMKVSSPASLSRSLLLTGFAYDRYKRSHFYTEFYRQFMVRCHDVRRSGSASLDMAWIAAGRADGFWEFNLSPWDVAAGLLLIEEAGGRVTDFNGKAWTDPRTFGAQTLATNRRIHRPMQTLLSRQLQRSSKGARR